MGEQENKSIVRRLVQECVNRNRADLLDEFIDSAVRVYPGTPGAAPPTEGIQQLREGFAHFHAVFPDLRVTHEDELAEGDRVAVRWTAAGTHSADLAGVAATGKAVTWGGTDTYRLLDGKIVEWWRNDDFVWLLHQLGRDLL